MHCRGVRVCAFCPGRVRFCTAGTFQFPSRSISVAFFWKWTETELSPRYKSGHSLDTKAHNSNTHTYTQKQMSGKTMLEQMSNTLATGGRIEVRGFGSFSLHYRAPRIGRNPKTGESVGLSGKHVPHFKPGKELRDRVNSALERSQAAKAES